ncbi:MAG: glycosyltransferase [Verrucomicrobia bacterium]|nr:glycosyltransferase [Verrucomicrobiota bacterium]
MKVAYFVMRYPWRSQTFIAREMRAVCGHGIEVQVYPIWEWRWRPPTPPPEDRAAGLKLVRLSPWRVLRDSFPAILREQRRDRALLGRAWEILRNHPPHTAEGWLHTIWGTLFALTFLEEFRRSEVMHFHGAWATAPATVAAVLAALTGRTFSFGAHAYDLHRAGGDPLLDLKLRYARFVHTSTLTNERFLQERFPNRKAEIVLARRGLEESSIFPLPPRPGLKREQGVRLLSVGRLVEKKGHIHQIQACQELLRRGVPFHLKIIGDGPLYLMLQKEVTARKLKHCVELAGAQPWEDVSAAYRSADIFWHTGAVDAQGDRDGLPNVIPEAFAHGLPVISSRLGGANEAVIDGETGLLVDTTDAQALATAVERLVQDDGLRRQLGLAGRAWTETYFRAEKNSACLVEAFRRAVSANSTER